MCAVLPLLLLVAIAPWPLGAPTWLSVTIDLAMIGALGWMWRAIVKPVREVGGIPVAELPGHPCPACGSTETELWAQGRLPMGVHCRRCGRRSAAAEIASAAVSSQPAQGKSDP
ncbi:MAG: hypothetical protein ACE366_25365 [Bradymonadia bacterium]